MKIIRLSREAFSAIRGEKPQKKLKRKIVFAAGMMFGCGQAKSTAAPEPPVIASLEPAYGAPGDTVIMRTTGTNPRVRVEFAGANTTPIEYSEAQLKVRVPDGAQTGEVRLVSSRRRSNPAAFEVALPDSEPWASVSAGSFHNCGVKSSGALYCWGENDASQLGVLRNAPVAYPRAVTAPAGTWRFASGGKYFERGNTCAIHETGNLWCFGDNLFGQFGNGNRNSAEAPVFSAQTHTWDMVTLGAYHACGIAGTALFCWGTEQHLGVGNTVTALFPNAVSAPASETGWRAADAGSLHTCAISEPGARLYCWGDNRAGQLGDGTTQERLVPVEVSTGGAWHAVLAGSYHDAGNTCAVDGSGKLWCWGDSTYGQIGDGTKNSSPVPVPVVTTQTWRAVSVGHLHVCAVSESGTLWCWGSNAASQLGKEESVRYAYAPVQVNTDTDWRDVSAGAYHTCATKVDGTLWCWGDNSESQLGMVSTEASVFVPRKVAFSFH